MFVICIDRESVSPPLVFAQKTVTVLVDHYVQYPKTIGLVRRSSKFKAHDEYNICDIGDWFH